MRRATCAALVQTGSDFFLRRQFPPPKPALHEVFNQLQARASEYFRGEEWPLPFAFGVLARFVNCVNEAGDSMSTPEVISTWLSDARFICCSCMGGAKHVGRLRAAHWPSCAAGATGGADTGDIGDTHRIHGPRKVAAFHGGAGPADREDGWLLDGHCEAARTEGVAMQATAGSTALLTCDLVQAAIL